MNGGIIKRGMRLLWVCVVVVLLGGGYVVCLFEGRGEAAELAKEEKNDGEYDVKRAIAITAHNHIHQKSHENEGDAEEELGISEFVAEEFIIFQRAARGRQRRELVEVTSIGKDQALLNVAEVMRGKGRLEKELVGPAAALIPNVDDQEIKGGMILSVKKEVSPNVAEEGVGAADKGARSRRSSSEKKLGFKPLNMGRVRGYRRSAEKKKKKNRRMTYEASVYAGEGQFLTVLRIGTPPVSFTAILDTGSDLVWRQCQPCSQCYPQTDYGFPIFDPASSSTFRKASCESPFCPPAQIYGGSCTPASSSSLVNTSTCSYDSLYDDPPAFTRGDLSFDTLSLSDSSGCPYLLPNFVFGCSHESHGPYNFAGSGGIVGFGEGTLSLPSQLGISRFSYCLQSTTSWSIHHQPSPRLPQQQQTALSSSSPSSSLQQHSSLSPFLATRLLFGDDAHLGDGGNIQSTRIVEQGYIVKLLGISVAGRRLNVSRSVFVDGGTLIDSGTTFTTLPTQAFHALYSAFKAFIPLKPWHANAGSGPRNLSLCYTSLPSPIPSLTFHFKGATLHLRSHNYFVLINNLYCLAFLETQDSQTVYGNVQQQDFHILYDLHSRLISFKPTSCASLHRR